VREKLYRSLALLFVGNDAGLSARASTARWWRRKRLSLPRAEVSFAYSSDPGQLHRRPMRLLLHDGVSAGRKLSHLSCIHHGGRCNRDPCRYIHNTGEPFSMLMVTGGMRINFRMGHQRTDGWDTYHRFKPFAQGLVGFAMGSMEAFPNKSTGFFNRAPVQ